MGPPIKNQGPSARVDSLQAMGYNRIMNKKYWLLNYFTRPHNELSKYYIKKVEKFFSKKKKPETVTITQTEYDNLVDFWNEHHS